MKKLKAILLGFALCMAAPLVAEDFSWVNYGAGIEKGDKLLSVDASLGWGDFAYFGGGVFYTPWVYGDFQIAVPLGSINLPFTFGGFVGANFVLGNYFSVDLALGGSAAYHIRLPLDKFDLYAGLKIGLRLYLGNWYYRKVGIDWGLNIGASYFFSDAFGVNVELGYPGFKGGVIFKF